VNQIGFSQLTCEKSRNSLNLNQLNKNSNQFCENLLTSFRRGFSFDVIKSKNNPQQIDPKKTDSTMVPSFFSFP
jgi:hypothetical protein